MGTDYGNFNKSDMGAQAAWKGFSSQTLYIASRLMGASDEYLFYPEDIEDLVVKKDDAVIEAVQVKNISSDLTLSSLASTKSSKGGERFFKRVCYLHAHYPDFSLVKVIYFQELQARGISIPVLIPIRDEDFNMTPIRNNSVRIEIVEIELTQQEARRLYNQYTETIPHPQFRSFEEAWGA